MDCSHFSWWAMAPVSKQTLKYATEFSFYGQYSFARQSPANRRMRCRLRRARLRTRWCRRRRRRGVVAQPVARQSRARGGRRFPAQNRRGNTGRRFGATSPTRPPPSPATNADTRAAAAAIGGGYPLQWRARDRYPTDRISNSKSSTTVVAAPSSSSSSAARSITDKFYFSFSPRQTSRKNVVVVVVAGQCNK